MSWGPFEGARVTAVLATALSLGTPAASLLGGNAGTALAQRIHDTCDYCHNLHGAAEAQLTDYLRAEDLCMSCHADGAPATYNGETVPKGVAVHAGGKHTPPDTTSCRDCHDHEGETGSNLALIPVALDNRYTGGLRAVVFLDTTDFADGDATYDGVCEVCHTTTDYHRQGGGMPAHNAQRDCPACHTHASGFAPAGGACTDCHGSIKGSRRAVVAEFDRPSHHAASPADTLDCVVCHDQSEHQQGNVRLWNVDDPGNTAAATVLTGDPNASSAEAASLTAFCQACHDADGANGDTTPFTDGTTVPVVDAPAWALASHNSSSPPVSCYGDGQFGCHASGHGSEKLKLLAPAAVAPTAPANAEEEEGFCFGCHDTDGPAGTDLQSLFSPAIKWVTDAVGDYNNLNLNDRHDVQYSAQATSGAKLECTDCHDPHTATSSQKVVLDPDPADGNVPVTMDDFCLDCHDGSFPSTVTAPTTQLFDVSGTFLGSNKGDGMADGDGNATLKAGYGWGDNQVVACLSCHDPHASGNLFHAVDVVYSMDGSTPVPTDGGGSYSITNNNIDQADINSYSWCNTCHTGSMGAGKSNCFSCHYHGTRW
jgi:predicted CXXCH cytochrome family protein